MFRPCIDLHDGQVKQIVGGTLSDETPAATETNFTSKKPSSYYAELYQKDGLKGGHVIMLGQGNEKAAIAALKAYPGGLQVGGGVNPDNASTYLDAGASHIIVTSYIFKDGQLIWENLEKISKQVGKDKLVIDLSCRIRDGQYYIVTDRWQKFTDVTLSQETLEKLSDYCSEYLVHAVDVEGMCKGIDMSLVKLLADASPIPSTYAGGAKSIEDLKAVYDASQGQVGLTIGSALDIFGGNLIKYEDAVAFNKLHS